jgi:NADH-quinone oxidoreductase subunit H
MTVLFTGWIGAFLVLGGDPFHRDDDRRLHDVDRAQGGRADAEPDRPRTKVGVPHGWLQPLADIAKLIVKEDATPRAADRLLFNVGPVLVVVPALIGFAFLPLAPDLALADHAYSFLFFVAFASLTLLGVFAAGWSSNNKYALLSALRMVAMAASYEVPLLLSLLIPAVLSGSFRLVDVVEAQRGLWFIAYPGIGQVGF